MNHIVGFGRCWRICLLLIGVCVSVPSIAQTNKVEDSLKQLLVKAANDSVKIKLYNQLRRATYYSDPASSQQYTFQFLQK